MFDGVSLRRRPQPAPDPHDPDPVFDADWYLRTYPDITAERGHLWAHFLEHGDAEGRSPGPTFDPVFYRHTYLPLETGSPVLHYITTGRGAGHVTRRSDLSFAQSYFGMNSAMRGRRHPVLLIGNDAQRAGAPILLLEIAARLRARGMSPVFVLQRGGPLFAEYAAIGPTLIADEGWDLAGLGAAVPLSTPVLASTGWGAPIAQGMRLENRTVLLVQEMRGYLAEHDLLDAVTAARTIVVAMPSIRDELMQSADPLDIRVIMPGLRAPARTQRGRADVLRELDAVAGPDRTVFLGAGYADQRKGFDLFLEAAHDILEQQPSSVFVWLGELSAWARDLADQAIEAGLPLILPGFRQDAADWYAATDVYLLTSRHDPGPTTVMDAAFVGAPFVGYEANIGLRAMGELLHPVGSFVRERADFVRQALELAGTDTTHDRAARAKYVRRHVSLDRYVDQLCQALAETGTTTHIPLPLSKLRLVWAKTVPQVPAHSVDELRQQAGKLIRQQRSLLRDTQYRVGRIAPAIVENRKRRRMRGLPTVAVRQSGGAPASALQTPDEISEKVRPGEHEWLAGPELLEALPMRTAVHMVRDKSLAPWPLVRTIEDASDRIALFVQHDAARPPGWVAAGSAPPKIRAPRRLVAPIRSTYSLAQTGPVRLARPVGVFVHVYYVELAEKLAERIALIDYPIQVYVSTDRESKAAQIREIFPDAIVRVFANRGRDVYPKIFGFAAEHQHHDVVLHLHTKRSPHRPDLSDWLSHIVDRLLPSTEGISAILALFAEVPSIGMVGPAPHRAVSNAVGWGPNRSIAEALTWQQGWPALPENADLVFAAGSMFWARSAALAPLQKLAIPESAFVEHDSRQDGTVAHAVERLAGVSCQAAGLRVFYVDEPAGRHEMTTRDIKALLRRRR